MLKDEDMDHLRSYMKNKTVTEHAPVTIRLSHGELVFDSRILRRTFHFFDDLLSEFPDSPIDLSHITDKMFYRTLWGLGFQDRRTYYRSPLSTVLETLRLFNPKKTSYYFRYNTAGTSAVDLLDLASRLSDEERTTILEAWRFSSLLPLPSEGVGHHILAAIMSAHRDIEGITTLFGESHPSFTALSPGSHREHILTMSFGDRVYLSQEGEHHVMRSILNSMTSETVSGNHRSPSEIKRGLAMLWLGSTMKDTYYTVRMR